MRFELATTGFTEELPLVFRRDDLQQIAFVATLVQAHTALWVLDQVKLCFLDLQHIHEFFGIDVAWIEEEVMRRNRKQRLRVLTNAANEEVFDILRGQNDGGVFLSDALGCVADILDGRGVGVR